MKKGGVWNDSPESIGDACENQKKTVIKDIREELVDRKSGIRSSEIQGINPFCKNVFFKRRLPKSKALAMLAVWSWFDRFLIGELMPNISSA